MKAYIAQFPTEELKIRLANPDGSLPDEVEVGNWMEVEISEATIEAIRFATPEAVRHILQQIVG